MTTKPIGLVLFRSTPSAGVDAILDAERYGIPTIWSTVGGTNPDAMTLFAAAAARTKQIGFGTAIVPTYTRHPIVLATQALVISDLAPGRLRLGIGPSHRPVIKDVFGLPFPKPLVYMREYMKVLRDLLWDGHTDFQGEFFSVHTRLPTTLTPPRLPLLTSALRSNAFRLAGEISDGAISWVCPISYLVETALPALQSGAAAAERPVPPLIAHVPVVVHTDRDAVHAAASAFLSRYAKLPFYANMFADAGYPIQDSNALPKALLDELIVSGDAATVVKRLEQILARGMSELLVTVIPAKDAVAEETALMQALSTSQ